MYLGEISTIRVTVDRKTNENELVVAKRNYGVTFVKLILEDKVLSLT